MLMFAALEWGGVLGGMSIADRLHNAWFHSVTLRTAGFNSVDVAAVGPATLALMLVWMFVGGGPGGTAGGVKVTTASVLLLAAVAAVRGREAVEVFGRRIPHRTVYRAAAIATLGVAFVLAALLALLLTQTLDPREALFEVVSAVGTVGLSVGGTTKLDNVGKAVIMLCMFLGRVGPLSAFMILTRQGSEPVWRFPEEEVEVG
jgi:trk system potassium uptake protein TrkH